LTTNKKYGKVYLTLKHKGEKMNDSVRLINEWFRFFVRRGVWTNPEGMLSVELYEGENCFWGQLQNAGWFYESKTKKLVLGELEVPKQNLKDIIIEYYNV